MATGLYKGFVANIVRSVGGVLVLVFYDRARTAPEPPSLAWFAMPELVHPILCLVELMSPFCFC